MEHLREFKEEMEIVEEKAEESPHEVHKSALSNPSPQTRDVSIAGGGKVRQTWGTISASLGAMRPLVAKLDKLLLDPPEGCSSKKVKDKIHLLKEDVKEISSCLDKLSELEDTPPTTKCWMNETRDLSYKIEDYIDSLLFVKPVDPSLVVDNIKTTKSLRKWFSHVKTPKGHEQIAATVSEFRKNAQEKIERRKVYVLSDSKIESSLSHRVVSVNHVLPMPYEETAIMVIDARMNEFINSLANDGDEQLKVVSVLGSACLGKTTLARLLYGRIGKRYHCRAFIRVSKKPDMKRIFHDMLSQLQRQDSPKYRNEVDLIDNIKMYLRDKRYLIILDDVWAASVWDIINDALPKGSHGSRIITTTQIEDVALTCCRYQSDRVFKMKPLDYHHSRKLFFNRLFGSESDCPEELKEVSNKIVEICDGLPLATISMASLLASQPVMSVELLTNIHKSLSSCFSANPSSERTRQALNLSFNNLPQYLKTCLMYLIMYPDGYTFFKDNLVKQLVAEGFIDTTEGQDVEKVAENYLHQLIGRRFIQPIRINFNNEVLSCAVHDVVHDLIAEKCIEDNFIVAIDYSEKNVALSHKARRLSILFGARYAKAPAYIIKSQVRSLTFLGLFDCMPSITEFKLLRVLNLHLSGHRHGDQDPAIDLTGISELFHLKYLKIVCDVCMKLPRRMRGLQCLETLDVMDITRGTDFPWDIIYLPHLLHLCLPADTNLLDWSGLVRLGKLNHLQDLCISTPPSSDSDHLERSVEALGSLISGHGSLKTIKVVAHESSVRYGGASIATIGWLHLEPPLHLQRFELSPHSRIIFYGIPWSIEQLGNLCILKIAVKGLSIDDVETLRGMPALTALSLDVETAPFIKITFGKVGFSSLKYFKLKCMSGIAWLKFEADAMPTLWKLKLVFNANPRMEQHQHGTAVIIIDHMPSLKEVSVKFRGAAADVEYALRTFVSNHPSNPTINMQPVDYSSYGEENTTQKHQQDEIMEEEPDEYYKQEPDKIVEEEPDEYDKTLERPADKRIIIMPPESSSRLHVPGDGSQSIQQDVNWEASSRYPPEWVGSHEFSLDELMSATSNFSEENLLGKSILGSIYKGTIDGKIMVAITKLTYHRSLHPERIMHHPHMVRLLGYCHQDAHNIYVYEYMPRGSLKCHLLETNLIASLPWLTRLKIAVGAAKGLSFLHESVKRRLSGGFGGSSILLASDYTAKLWGFVLAMQSDVMLREIQKSDNVYQFGVVLLELLSGRPHFGRKRLGPKRDLVKWSCPYLLSEDKLHHIMDPILEGQYSLSAAWRTATIARLCLNSVPEEQPSMRDVVEALEPLLNDDRDDCQLVASGKPE